MRCYRYSYLVVAILLFALGGCATGPVRPLTDGKNHYGQSQEEKRLIVRAREFNDELKSKGLLLPDADINNYISGVGQRLLPTETTTSTVHFRFSVVRDPTVNAFALADGTIYATVGLLARLENEAQLAQVLSHEISHVVLRHALRGYRQRTSSMISANIADLALFGTSLVYMPYVMSVASYSREMEEEADRMSLSLMSHAGYPLANADRLFQILEEVRGAEAAQGSVYSSHPSNVERAAYIREAVKNGKMQVNADGDNGKTRYLRVRSRLVLENIKLKLNVKQYRLAADAAESEMKQRGESPVLEYYRGEAYRAMAEDPKGAAAEHAWIYHVSLDDKLLDETRGHVGDYRETARASYLNALRLDPRLALAHRGLGLVLRDQQDPRNAATHLREYLARSPRAGDRPYIENILKEMENAK